MIRVQLSQLLPPKHLPQSTLAPPTWGTHHIGGPPNPLQNLNNPLFNASQQAIAQASQGVASGVSAGSVTQPNSLVSQNLNAIGAGFTPANLMQPSLGQTLQNMSFGNTFTQPNPNAQGNVASHQIVTRQPPPIIQGFAPVMTPLSQGLNSIAHGFVPMSMSPAMGIGGVPFNGVQSPGFTPMMPPPPSWGFQPSMNTGMPGFSSGFFPANPGPMGGPSMNPPSFYPPDAQAYGQQTMHSAAVFQVLQAAVYQVANPYYPPD